MAVGASLFNFFRMRENQPSILRISPGPSFKSLSILSFSSLVGNGWCLCSWIHFQRYFLASSGSPTFASALGDAFGFATPGMTTPVELISALPTTCVFTTAEFWLGTAPFNWSSKSASSFSALVSIFGATLIWLILLVVIRPFCNFCFFLALASQSLNCRLFKPVVASMINFSCWVGKVLSVCFSNQSVR